MQVEKFSIHKIATKKDEEAISNIRTKLFGIAGVLDTFLSDGKLVILKNGDRLADKELVGYLKTRFNLIEYNFDCYTY